MSSALSIRSQAEFIRNYNDNHREKFNQELFQRNEMDIINELQKVILSAQRDQMFKIKVKRFDIIDNYSEIMDIMYNYEESLKSKGNKRRKVDNPYEFVNLKDSDVLLLKVTYTITAKDGEEELEVLILVPRIVDKYYFKINGNYYFAMYQIAEASTYNNSTSQNAKKLNITFRTTSTPIKVYRNHITMNTVNGDTINNTYYSIRAFSKTFNIFKYLLANYGLYGTMDMTLLTTINFYDTEPPEDDNMYTFTKNNIFISVPKMIYNNDYTIQTFVHCLVTSVKKDTAFNDIFTVDYWKKVLGGEFSNYSVAKGESLLKSIETSYDITTKDDIHLPEDYKKDIYHILRWMIREFNHLKNKDNLDISTKKVKFAENIAALYAIKLSQGTYRLSENSVSLKDIKKSINIKPTLLLENITRCNLVNYRNLSNDLDSLIATKFTYKGISGMGEKNSRNIPGGIKYVHPSHQGRVDMDTSPKSDPGMSGVICPLTTLHDRSFSEFEEPNTWEDNFAKLMDRYKKTVGLKEIFRAEESLLGKVNREQESVVDESIRIFKNIFVPVSATVDDLAVNESNIEYLEGGGRIYVEY